MHWAGWERKECVFNNKQPLKNSPDFSVLSFQAAKYVPYIPQKSELLNFRYFRGLFTQGQTIPKSAFQENLAYRHLAPSYLFPSILAITYIDISNQSRGCVALADHLDMQTTWTPHPYRGLTKCFTSRETGAGRKRVTKWQGIVTLWQHKQHNFH